MIIVVRFISDVWVGSMSSLREKKRRNVWIVLSSVICSLSGPNGVLMTQTQVHLLRARTKTSLSGKKGTVFRQARTTWITFVWTKYFFRKRHRIGAHLVASSIGQFPTYFLRIQNSPEKEAPRSLFDSLSCGSLSNKLSKYVLCYCACYFTVV